MELSIIILHHGSPKEVMANLQALHGSQLPVKTEVLVINNGYAGANAAIPFDSNESFKLRYFEIENRGYAQGNNFGLKQAQGRFLCILNPDIEVQKNTFEVLITYLKNHPRVGIVAPRLRYPDGMIQDNYRKFPRPFDLLVKRTFLRRFFRERMRHYLMWDKDPERSEPVDWLTGAFQLFTRRAWSRLKPNDERFFLFMSDVDFCRKAWEKGLEVHFVGKTEALHKDGRLSAGGVLAFFKKRAVRLHVWDAFKYYWKFLLKPLPRKEK